MSTPPNIEAIAALLGELRQQFAEQREEARESSSAIREQLDRMSSQIARVDPIDKRVGDLESTVHGAKDQPGLKGRQDRSERTLGLMVWAMAAAGVVAIGKALEWLSNLGHPASGGKP